MRTVTIGLFCIFVLLALVTLGQYGIHGRSTQNISIATSTVATSTDVYTIEIAYPRFGIEKVDASVQAIVDKAVKEFQAMPPNPTPVAAKNELIGTYQIINTGPDYLSARLEIYQYTGGAHGTTAVYGLNFHKDGTSVTQQEAISLTGKDLSQISSEATTQLQSRFGMVQFPEGAAAKDENYSTFLVGTSTVSFIFQQYQVEAYAAGSPEIMLARAQ